MTQRALGNLCAVWQERLLLQEWTVTVALDRTLEHWAYNEWDKMYHTSKISISPEEGPLGHEFYLVHELQHLRLCDWKPKTKAEDDQKEEAINLLAHAYLRAYRRGKRKPKEQ